jgi:hypothetical protein
VSLGRCHPDGSSTPSSTVEDEAILVSSSMLCASSVIRRGGMRASRR